MEVDVVLQLNKEEPTTSTARLRGDDEGNVCVIPPVSGLPYRFFLTESGDGLGNFNFNGDYSTTPIDIYYEATARFEMYSFLVAISDSAKFLQSDYGAITGGITNGITIFVRPAGTTTDIPILTNVGIKHNYEWLSITPDTQVTDFSGLAQSLVINVDLIHQYGRTLTINKGAQLRIHLADNFSGLVSHTFGIRGTLFNGVPVV